MDFSNLTPEQLAFLQETLKSNDLEKTIESGGAFYTIRQTIGKM